QGLRTSLAVNHPTSDWSGPAHEGRVTELRTVVRRPLSRALGGEGCHLHRSYAGRSNEPPRALGVYVRKGAAQPLPPRQETAHGPQVFRGPVPLHPACWPELGQRAQELPALPERVPRFRNGEARACNSCCAAPQAGRAEEPEEGRGPCCECAGVRA